MTRLLFVGECRSLTAQRKGWTWKDGRLAAKPLFEALAAMGVDVAACDFVNLWSDNATGQTPGRGYDGAVAIIAYQKVTHLRCVSSTKGRGRRIVVALGKRVSDELTARAIDHVALIHPAARGKIRKRARYHRHVKQKLAPHVGAR